MKIVADDKIPFLKGVLEQYAEVVYLPGDFITKSDLRDADALLTRSITQCNEDLLADTSIKFIASATIGDDHIDKDFCKKSNITWTTAKGCNAAAVEQYFTTGLLALADKYQIDLSGKTIGIIGVGHIGKRVQKVSQLLGLKVLLNDPPRERVEGPDGFSTLDKIQENADIISLHTPLNFGGDDKTFHLIDQAFFEGLEKPIILINTSRGAVVDSSSLKNAIEEGKVKHALLDVWEGEPDVDDELMELIDIATPHIAGYSLEGKANGTSMVVNAVSDFFKLDLGDWTPEIPSAKRILEIDCSSLSDHEVLQKVFNEVYPIFKDDQEFRTKPGKFEKLRRDYKYRRENNTFYLQLTGISERLKSILKEFGFQFYEQKINIQN
jgi:erythronate-4-phosphate dehydrogenase